MMQALRITCALCCILLATAEISSAEIPSDGVEMFEEGMRRLNLFDDPVVPTNRIVNGDNVDRASKYMEFVRIQKFDFNKQPRFVCGGSAITRNMVLTAGHCAIGANTDYQVQVGAYNHDGQYYAQSRVSEIISHPEYQSGQVAHDFAIMVLTTPLPEGYPLVTLNRQEVVPSAGTSLRVVGMGRIYDGGPISEVLQEANVRSISYASCYQVYRYHVSNDDMLCAEGVYRNGLNVDSCSGDSGGPLFLDGTKIQVGIVSWGAGCGVYPGVYARVSYISSWVDTAICENSVDSSCKETGGDAARTAPGCTDNPEGFVYAARTRRGRSKRSRNIRLSCEFIGRLAFNFGQYLYCGSESAQENCKETCGLCSN